MTIVGRPSVGGMRKVLEVIWGKWEQKYSENPKKRLDTLSTTRPTGKSLDSGEP